MAFALSCKKEQDKSSILMWNFQLYCWCVWSCQRANAAGICSLTRAAALQPTHSHGQVILAHVSQEIGFFSCKLSLQKQLAGAAVLLGDSSKSHTYCY